MAFSKSQLVTHYGPMVSRAWKAHCYRECITDSTEASKKAWKEKQLLKCVGVTSSNACNKTSDFEKVMAWFEEIVGDGSIYWQLQYLKGDAKRARHLLDETIQNLHLTEDYVTAVARQMGAHSIKEYTAEQLLKFRIALLTHVRRKQDRAVNQIQKELLAAPE